jgi:hypothetical protein
LETKSRALWLKEGDKSSKFFHRIANSHRNTNTIDKLNINGITSTCQDEIREHISQFYEQLYLEDGYHRPQLDGIHFYAISREEAKWLERLFDEEDIFTVVQGFNGDKALGPDGFSLAFFFRIVGVLCGWRYWQFVRNFISTVSLNVVSMLLLSRLFLRNLEQMRSKTFDPLVWLVVCIRLLPSFWRID